MHAGEQPPAPARGLPPSVRFDATGSARDYWLARLRQHQGDRYAGVPMAKLPEDLRVYEHLLWLSAPEVVIEVGTQYGGSALWFRDRLRWLASYGRIDRMRVISVDIDVAAAREEIAAASPDWHETITLVESDARDPELAARIAALVPEGARCLLSEDSAHDHETTLAALRGLSRFVHPGGFVIVEDGYIDVEQLRPDDDRLPRGVLSALDEWLAESGGEFERRRDLELYGLTASPFGLFQRKPAPTHAPSAEPQTSGSEDAGSTASATGADAEAEIAQLSSIVADLRRRLERWQGRATLAEHQREEWEKRALTAERLREQWEREVASLNERLATAAQRLETVYNSTSWRITEPLRKLMSRRSA